MVQLILLVGLVIGLLVLYGLQKLGWITLPKHALAIEIWALLVVPLLCGAIAIVLKIESLVAEEGLLWVASRFGLFVVVGAVIFLIGYFYFRYRRRNDRSEVQKLDLNE